MSHLEEIELFILLMINLGFLIATIHLARKSNRSVAKWVLLSLSITPIICYLILAIIGKRDLSAPTYGIAPVVISILLVIIFSIGVWAYVQKDLFFDKFINQSQSTPVEIEDSEETSALYQDLSVDLVGKQMYEYYPVLKENKERFFISVDQKKTKPDGFFEELSSYGVSQNLYVFNGFTVGANMLPHSGGTYLTFFINNKSGQIYYLKYSGCEANEICKEVQVFGADKNHKGEYTVPDSIRSWISKELSSDAEKNMVVVE